MHHAYLELEKFENIEDPYFQKYEEASPLDVLQSSYEKSMLEMKKEARFLAAFLYFIFLLIIFNKYRVLWGHQQPVLPYCDMQS